MAYLDNTGLAEVWAKIKGYFGHALAIDVQAGAIDIKLNNGESTPATLNTITIPLANTINSTAGLMTSAEKDKLAGIASGAEANVQSDWNVTNTNSDAYIKNKPTIPDSTSDLTNDSGFITSADVPSPSSTTPVMDGTAAVGTGTTYARADHVHPTDTSRASASEFGTFKTSQQTWNTNMDGRVDDLEAHEQTWGMALDYAERNKSIWHATCSTTAGTAAKVAALDETTGFTLSAGVVVAVTFQYGNSAATPTLNVNSTGAKQIVLPRNATEHLGGNGTTYNSWGAYETILFTYTGSQWEHTGSGYLQYQAYNKADAAMPTAGGTFTGAPKYAADPDDSNTLTRKSYVDTAIGNAIAGVQGISYEIVQTLPASGSAGVIYLVSNSGTAPNVYDEYIWVSNAFEKIGTTAVDLSGYWAKSELVAMTTAEVDAICV